MTIATFVGNELLPRRLMLQPATHAARSGGFDVCNMWDEIGWVYRLAILIWFFSFITVLWKGLRTRLASRAAALFCFPAFFIWLTHDRWRFEHCYSAFGVATSVILGATCTAVCLHHVLLSRSDKTTQIRKNLPST